MNKTILNKVEASEQTGLSQRTIYTWANAGKIHKYFSRKHRKTFLVCLEEIKEFIEKRV